MGDAAEAPKLATLPHDALFLISAFLPPPDLLVLGAAGRVLRQRVGADAQLWRSALRRHFQLDAAFRSLDSLLPGGETRRPFSATAGDNWFRCLYLKVLARAGRCLGWWISDRPFLGELLRVSLLVGPGEGGEPSVRIAYRRALVENLAAPTFVTCGSVVVGADGLPLFSTGGTSNQAPIGVAGTWTALVPVTVNVLKERLSYAEIFSLVVPDGLLPRWKTDPAVADREHETATSAADGKGKTVVRASPPDDDPALKPFMICRGTAAARMARAPSVADDGGDDLAGRLKALSLASAGLLDRDEVLLSHGPDHLAELRWYKELHDSGRPGSGRLPATDLYNPSFILSPSHFAVDCPRSCHSYISHHQASAAAVHGVRPGDVGLMFDPSSLPMHRQQQHQGGEGELLEDLEYDSGEEEGGAGGESRAAQQAAGQHVPHAPLSTARGPVFPARYFRLRVERPMWHGAGEMPAPGEMGWEPELLQGLWVSTYRTRPPAFLSVVIHRSPYPHPPELRAYKLTGNPNVPRGALSFTASMDPLPPGAGSPVADEDEELPDQVVYQHLPPPGVRERVRIRGVRARFPARKQFATPAYRNSYFSPSELLVVGNDEFVVFSYKHAHITRYRKMPADP